MKPNMFAGVFLAGLLAIAPLFLCAQVPPARTKGTVAILQNDRALEGDIERNGTGYVVRRQAGELWLPTAQVKRLCADWNEALAVMRSQANLLDADERLRLAHWCEQNNLYPQAIAEAREALAIRPKHLVAQQYLDSLERSAQLAAQPSAPEPDHKDLDDADTPMLDLSADSLGLFVTKVQPILMNTCATCHANNQNSKFRLQHVSGISASWQRATQVNMVAAVRQINIESAALSPLLVKSVSKHGNAQQPPLTGTSSQPYLLLRQWVELTIANNPHLRQDLGQTAVATLPVLIPATLQPPAAPVAPPVASPPVATLPAPGVLPDLGSKIQPLESAPGQVASTGSGFAAPGVKIDGGSKFAAPGSGNSTEPTGPGPVASAVYKTFTPQLAGSGPPDIRNAYKAAAIEGPDEYSPRPFNQKYHPGKE